MALVAVDPASGALLEGGRKLFPLCLSNGPPADRNAPSGRNGLAEVAAAGINMVRTGTAAWGVETAPGLIALERQKLDAAASHGLFGWLWLGDLTDLPPRTTPSQPSDRERLLQTVVNGLKAHPALAVWKGVDEPRNPARGDAWIRPAGLVRGYERVKQLDPRHPLVVIQAPGSTAAQLTPYRPAFDLTGMDVYPVSYPPGIHGGGDEQGRLGRRGLGARDRNCCRAEAVLDDPADRVDGRRPLAAAARRGPALSDLAAGAVHGAPGDRQRRPRPRLLRRPPDPGVHAGRREGRLELDVLGPHPPPAHRRAVVRRRPPRPRRAEGEGDGQGGIGGVEVATRQEGRTLWVLAARRDGGTSTVGFTGLPSKHDGQKLTRGEVLSEWVQDPPPPPLGAGRQVLRSVAVENRGFRDWFGPLDARIYRFRL